MNVDVNTVTIILFLIFLTLIFLVALILTFLHNAEKLDLMDEVLDTYILLKLIIKSKVYRSFLYLVSIDSFSKNNNISSSSNNISSSSSSNNSQSSSNNSLFLTDFHTTHYKLYFLKQLDSIDTKLLNYIFSRDCYYILKILGMQEMLPPKLHSTYYKLLQIRNKLIMKKFNELFMDDILGCIMQYV